MPFPLPRFHFPFLALLLALPALPGTARADFCPDWRLGLHPPIDVRLTDPPEPMYVNVRAGGTVDVTGCYDVPGEGFYTSEPTLTLSVQDMGERNLYLVAETICFARILVSDVRSEWIFDPEAPASQQPQMVLSGPSVIDGRIDIWLGATEETDCPATITYYAATEPVTLGGGADPLPGDWHITANTYGGRMVIASDGAGGYTGHVNFLINGYDEPLSEIAFDPETGTLRFLNPRTGQVYHGVMEDGRLSGYFARGSAETGPSWYAWQD